MSKRMIHYHFWRQEGALPAGSEHGRAAPQPAAGSLDIDSAVPVEGVRTLVDWLFKQHVEHPEAIRMMTMETSTGALETGQALIDVSEVSLHLDKLLMLGQDSGAFRPGISANDIFTLIASLTMYRVTNRSMMQNLLDIDMHSPENTEGMHRMAVDAVLAFLTANIPDSGYSSYLSTEPRWKTTTQSHKISTPATKTRAGLTSTPKPLLFSFMPKGPQILSDLRPQAIMPLGGFLSASV